MSLDDEPDWVRHQRAHLRPIVVGRLGIHQPWAEPVGDVPVSIDPGPTFGHGAHPTTALCLAEIDRLAGPGLSVLDVGCGSGVLAIAAARLGAAPVRAVDIDPAAVDRTLRNAAANGCVIDVSTSPVSELPSTALVVANMLPSALLTEAEYLIRLATRWLVLSGIPDERADEVVARFAGPLRPIRRAHRDGWTGLTLQRG